MYFHNSLIPRGAYFLLPLESKQEATSGNFTKCFSEVKVNQLKVKNMHVRMGISIFKVHFSYFLNLFGSLFFKPFFKKKKKNNNNNKNKKQKTKQNKTKQKKKNEQTNKLFFGPERTIL